MAHYVFNFTDGDREAAAALVRVKMWGISVDERHREQLIPGDVALIYVAASKEFIGRAEITTAVHEWTSSEGEAYPADSRGGVLLSHVEEWDPVVPMDAVVLRIDPTGSNPYVQANAAHGFPMGVVQITADESEAAVAVSRDAQAT